MIFKTCTTTSLL